MLRPLAVACTLGIVLTVTMSGAAPRTVAPAAATPPDSIVLELITGDMAITPATTREYLAALRVARRPLDGFALFRRDLRTAERASLATRGLILLSHAETGVYRVRILPAFAADAPEVRAHLVAAARLRPQDRVLPDVWRGIDTLFRGATARGDTNYLRAAGDSLRLRVTVSVREPDTAVQRQLRTNAANVVKVGAGQWTLTASRAALAALATPEWVTWIDVFIPRLRRETDVTRGKIGVDVVQGFSETLGRSTLYGGAGITVAVFDNGIDEKHPDFSVLLDGTPTGVTRVTDLGGPASLHGTMVAGLIAGNGKNSDGFFDGLAPNTPNGGSPYGWRGMAPEAHLLDVYNEETLIANRNALADMFHKAIVTLGAHLSNHSYGVELLSAYGFFAAQRDSLIRGDATLADGTAIPARLQVFSAGNKGADGYFSMNPGQTKNGIMVGNWRLNDTPPRLSGSSSIGPTADGRLKPDLIAPASPIKTTGYWSATEERPAAGTCLDAGMPANLSTSTATHSGFYTADCGTSLAAAVVSGITAQLLQQMRDELGMNIDATPPFPSTLKGILLHSATDVTQPAGYSNSDGPLATFAGPDVTTGFGLVDAKGASDLVAMRLWKQGSIADVCATWNMSFRVLAPASGNPNVKMTLVWDDAAMEPLKPPTETFLKNDLDLVLVDPGGTTHYPHLVNQVIKDAAGNPLAPAAQPCNTPIKIDRQLASTGPITQAMLAAAHAGKGPDHLNNVEQVSASGPPGIWKATVTGFRVPLGPQTFSLVGAAEFTIAYFAPLNLCKRYPFFCTQQLYNICARYPLLCDKPRYFRVWPSGPRVSFRDPRDRVILPVAALCAELAPRNRCEADVPYTMRVTGAPVSMGMEIFNGGGERVAGSARPSRHAELAFRPVRGTEYFLLLTPPDGVRPNVEFDLPVTIRRQAP